MSRKFKIGDRVYYTRNYGTYTDTLPCEITAVNKKTVNLNDGWEDYRNVRLSSIVLQSEEPSHINK